MDQIVFICFVQQYAKIFPHVRTTDNWNVCQTETKHQQINLYPTCRYILFATHIYENIVAKVEISPEKFHIYALMFSVIFGKFGVKCG